MKITTERRKDYVLEGSRVMCMATLTIVMFDDRISWLDNIDLSCQVPDYRLGNTPDLSRDRCLVLYTVACNSIAAQTVFAVQ